MQKFTTLLVVFAALAAGASAQSTNIEKPIRAEVGLYIPTFEGSGNNLGVTLGGGYAFYRKNGFELAGVARASFLSVDDSDISLTTFGIDGRYQPVGQKFFAGLGLGSVTGHEHVGGFGDGSTTKLGYSAELGYDFSSKVYGIVRYSGAAAESNAFRGVTVGVGYRF
jgi:hypothetical protein